MDCECDFYTCKSADISTGLVAFGKFYLYWKAGMNNIKLGNRGVTLLMNRIFLFTEFTSSLCILFPVLLFIAPIAFQATPKKKKNRRGNWLLSNANYKRNIRWSTNSSLFILFFISKLFFFCVQVRKVGKVARAIAIMSHPIPSTNDSHSVQIILPQKQLGRRSDM